jgi:cephalosporin hydroxylase
MAAASSLAARSRRFGSGSVESLWEDAPVSSRIGQAAKAPIRLFTRLTGFRAGVYVLGFAREDLAAFGRYLRSPRARRVERSAAADADTTDRAFEFSRAYFGDGPVQQRSEVGALLELAKQNGTHVVCEIGAWDAGTSVLFSRVLAPEILIVMDLYVKNRWRLRRAAPGGQSIHIIDGDSSQPGTVRRVRRALGGRPIDLLLIDGDHRWAGIRQDFLNYRQLVRHGGVIAFHDICEVSDQSGPAWTGDVPAFWRVVSSLYESESFVDSPGQQGMGIGVIHYDPRRPIAAVLDAVAPPAPAGG